MGRHWAVARKQSGARGASDLAGLAIAKTFVDPDWDLLLTVNTRSGGAVGLDWYAYVLPDLETPSSSGNDTYPSGVPTTLGLAVPAGGTWRVKAVDGNGNTIWSNDETI